MVLILFRLDKLQTTLYRTCANIPPLTTCCRLFCNGGAKKRGHRPSYLIANTATVVYSHWASHSSCVFARWRHNVMNFLNKKVNDCVQQILLQKFTNFHAILSWSFQNIWNEIGWPRFCATLYIRLRGGIRPRIVYVNSFINLVFCRLLYIKAVASQLWPVFTRRPTVRLA